MNPNPLDQTITTYKQHFDRYIERTPDQRNAEFKAWVDLFLSHIPKSGTILEIGSATGYDAKYFAKNNYKVVCTDIVPEVLTALAKEGFDTAEYDFRDTPNPKWIAKFDGVFANAVLLHASPDIFEKALGNISDMLKPNGILAFSLKTGTGEEVTHEKMNAPRYFCYYSPPEILKIMENCPFEVLSLSQAENKNWLHIIAKRKK